MPRAAVRSRKKKRGFAIVMTVLLLGLLVVVVVSLATLTGVETGIAGNTRKFSQARQNALMALNIAIGELQEAAGPDQRVTASAGITGAGIHPHWTGVWNTTGGGLERWLASGVTDELSDLSTSIITVDPGRTGVELVGLNSAGTDTGNYVSALLESIVAPYPDLPSGTVVGRYAWWIGDEGIKTSFASRERQDELDFDDVDVYTGGGGTAGSFNRRRIAQLAMPRLRVDDFMPLRIGTPDGASNLLLDRLVDFQQVQYVTINRPTAGTTQIGSTALRNRFHDITVRSRGVIADAKLGGLKLDLSDPSPLVSEELRWFLNLRPESSTETLATFDTGRRVEDGDPSTGPYFWVAPVISEVRFWWSFPSAISDATTGEIPLQWSWSVELWNPYNVALDLRQIEIEIENPGTVVLQGVSTSETVGQFRIFPSWDVPKLLLYPASEGPAMDEPWLFTFAGDSILPGQTIRATKSGSGFAVEATSGANIALLPAGSGYSVSVAGGDPLRFHARDVDGNEIQVIEPRGITDANQNAPRFSVLQYRIRDRLDDPLWLQSFDPRSRSLAYFGDVDSNLDPFDPELELRSGLQPPSWVDSTSGELISPANRAVAFDLPRQQQISIGALQHAHIEAASGANPVPFRLGNVWADDILDPLTGSGSVNFNSLFDRAYFSSIPRSISGSPWEPGLAPLPNGHVDVYNPLPSAPASLSDFVAMGSDSNDHLTFARLLIRDAFNLNSTSERAWISLLTGARLEGWRYQNSDSSTQVTTINNAIFGLPQTGQHIGQFYQANPSTSRAWQQGVRDLDDDQINELAREIVSRLHARAQPFTSIAEFVNDGLLDAAIGAVVPSDPGSPDVINAGIDSMSPGYLRQADLLNAWAPFLQVRSDTFLVRAYGEALDPFSDSDGDGVGDIQGRAWCEAVVQRVPDYIDESEEPWESPTGINATLGRRFKIVQFRWLTPDDI